jgi:hypothetical protein
VAIDVKEAQSAGWWMLRLAKQLHDEGRQKRLKLLDDWARGEPPLPDGATAARSAFQAFQRHACSNFALVIGEALCDRMRHRAIRTAVDSDDTGDADAWQLWRAMRGQVVAAEVHRMMFRFGEAYAIVGEPVDGVPVLTAEDPRYVIAEVDPLRPWLPRAFLKMVRDDMAGRDLAYLFRPGRLDVAFRDAPGRKVGAGPGLFSASGWTLDEELSGDLPAHPGGGKLMPVVAFRNLDGVGEFEPHLPLLARINHMILQRMMIATLQAFRQRALEGAPIKDDDGQPINWSDILSADPAAVWAIPEGVKIWESGQVNLEPILNAVKADVIHLAAVSRTPMSMLDPGGENQSAEGAALAREGLVFKAEDRIGRVDPAWAAVAAAAFAWQGDKERAQAAKLTFDWAPPQRMSLTERASAAAQAATAGVPWRTRMTDVMGFDPAHVDRMEAERLDDLLLMQQVAAAKAAQAAPQAPAGQPDTGSGAPAAQDGPQGADAGGSGTRGAAGGDGAAAGQQGAPRRKQQVAAGGR